MVTIEILEKVVRLIGEDKYATRQVVKKLNEEFNINVTYKAITYYIDHGFIKESKIKCDRRGDVRFYDINGILRIIFIAENKHLKLELLNEVVDIQNINKDNYRKYFERMINFKEHLKEYFNN